MKNMTLSEIITQIKNIFELKFLAWIKNLADSNNITKFCLVIVGIAVLFMVMGRLLKMGTRVLMAVLAVVFMVFAAPRINTFLINKIGEYGIVEQSLSNIVDGDIETKIKREYRIRTGEVLTDEATLEQIKNEQYQIDPNLSDELNILAHAGLPSGIMNTLLANFADWGTSTITATTFSDYVAKFFILRIVMLISYIIAFSAATRVFKTSY